MHQQWKCSIRKWRDRELDTMRPLPGKVCWSFILSKPLHALALAVEVIQVICLDM